MVVVFRVVIAAMVLAGAACGGKGTKTAAVACTDMCTAGGFTSGTATEYSSETNCVCTGTGTVTAAACTTMCTDSGKTSGEPYGDSGATVLNACSCQ